MSKRGGEIFDLRLMATGARAGTMPLMAPLKAKAGGSGQARRMIRLQRTYTCPGCAGEHHSWARLSSCPQCGRSLSVAVIRRAAFVGS